MASVEERLTKIEKEIEAIKTKIPADESKTNWLNKVNGTFRNDPDFDEIIRLGKEFRDSDRPKD
ncbi:MAG: hypothetical protein ACK6DC_09410 [Planctomycetota bacterium]|jgi:hypothetical protein